MRRMPGPIEWRKKWARCWDEMRFCSESCRSAGKRDHEGAKTIESTIRSLLHGRDASATICPSEVARTVFPDDWRERMEEVRRAARRLEGQGIVTGKQGGQRIDLATARGPIRIGRGAEFKP